jgi:hypothetical protein
MDACAGASSRNILKLAPTLGKSPLEMFSKRHPEIED